MFRPKKRSSGPAVQRSSGSSGSLDSPGRPGPGLPEGSWPVFVTDLDRVLAARTPKSEDLVRYVFFQSLVVCGVQLHQFAFEYPHPVEDRARVDTVLVDRQGRPEVALEVKFHRSNRSGTNLPRPQLAGMLVHDVARLATFTPSTVGRFLLYVTDNEMADYFSNPSNGLTWVTGLARGESMVLQANDFDALSETFRKAAGDWPGPVRVTVTQASDGIVGHFARLYRVDELGA